MFHRKIVSSIHIQYINMIHDKSNQKLNFEIQCQIKNRWDALNDDPKDQI